MNSKIINYLSELLSICIKFGIVPECFNTGLLIPILKKSTLDPQIPKNYRPITISSTFSKILELYILDVSSRHEFSDLQFGFIAGRGTNMAASLANDVISYCNKRGSAVFTCSLDAECAFDTVPHNILLYKSIGILPDHCWRILFNWYNALKVQIKYNNELSKEINVCQGTRQGGLTSPFLFNLFYQDMITQLDKCTRGIVIANTQFNVIAYADDILLTSLTATGLQTLINVANEYVTEHGLTFNPIKTKCASFGNCTLQPHPTWSLNDVRMSENNSIEYLGVVLNAKNSNEHVEKRIASCRKAFYSIQSTGLNVNSNNSCNMISYVWKTAIQPVLAFGCNSIHMSNIKN